MRPDRTTMTESLRPTTDPNAHDEVSLQRLNHLIWALLFFALALFAKFPGLDLLISARYYDPELGFFHRHQPVVIALYDWTPWIGRALVIALALYALLRLQAFLPYSLGREGMPSLQSLNTAVSFVTNTNWQSYSPDITLERTAR